MMLLSALVLLVPLGAGSPTEVDVSLETELTYDSNVLRYSDADLDAFVVSFKEDRFASAETYDDMIVVPRATLSVGRKGLGDVSLSWKESVFWRNPVKRYRVLSADISGPLVWGTDLEVGAFRLPRYHIRPIYDVDQGAYVSCNFAKTRVWARLGRSAFGGHDVSLGYRWEREDYTDEFYEYDNIMHTLSLQARLRLTRSIRPTIAYSFIYSPARAYDEPGEDADTSDETDGSYFEDQLRVGLRSNLAKPANRTLYGQTGITYRIRQYTTEKHPHVDPYHAGREDRRVLWEALVGWRWSRTVTVWASYEIERRWSKGTTETSDLGEEKEFTAHRPALGVRVSWSLRE
jgi:hypothetical protein